MADRRSFRRCGVATFTAGALSAVVVVGGGAAIASIPSSTTGMITACVNTSSDAGRIIDSQAGHHCAATEAPLNWSKGYSYRGAWSATVTYGVLDVVSSGGSSYLAKTQSLGKSPTTNPTYWSLLAARGATGPQGPSGPQRPAGASGYNVVTEYVTVIGEPNSSWMSTVHPVRFRSEAARTTETPFLA